MKIKNIVTNLKMTYTKTTLIEGTTHLISGSWKMLSVYLKSIYWKYNFYKCGKNLSIFPKVKINFPKNISVGNNVSINHGSYLKSENPRSKTIIHNNVEIGMNVKLDCSGGLELKNNVVISDGAHIHTHNHGLNPYNRAEYKKLTVEENVWVGNDVMILPQVSVIGKNSIIGARAVVTKDVPPNVVVAGNPARIIKELKK